MSTPPPDTRSLTAWTLSFLRPHRARVVLLVTLLLLQVLLGALQPWPLKMLIDNVLGSQPLPEPYRHWVLAVAGDSTTAWLVFFGCAGVVVQIVNQLASAIGTQVQVDTGMRMVYDLRGDFGLDPAQVRERFGFYFDAFPQIRPEVA